MTGIEPAYSAWEVFSAFERDFTSPQADALVDCESPQLRLHFSAGSGTVLNASDTASEGSETLSDAAPARPRMD